MDAMACGAFKKQHESELCPSLRDISATCENTCPWIDLHLRMLGAGTYHCNGTGMGPCKVREWASYSMNLDH